MVDNIALEDLGWMAGFFDGEGCISIPRANEYYKGQVRPRTRLSIGVANTNKEAIEIFKKCFNGSIHQRMQINSPQRRILYKWELSGKENQSYFLHCIVPFLKSKRLQGEIALQFLETVNIKGTFGRSYLPEDLLKQREVLKAKIQFINSPNKVPTSVLTNSP